MKIIASKKDGRVGPWFPESEPPADYVIVPDALYEKYKTGEIKDGFELAQKSLAVNAGYGVDTSAKKPAIRVPVNKEAADKPKSSASSLFPDVTKMRT